MDFCKLEETDNVSVYCWGVLLKTSGGKVLEFSQQKTMSWAETLVYRVITKKMLRKYDQLNI